MIKKIIYMIIETSRVVKWYIKISLFFMLYSCNTNSQKLLMEISLLQSKPINCGQNNNFKYDGIFQEKIKYVMYSASIRCALHVRLI